MVECDRLRERVVGRGSEDLEVGRVDERKSRERKRGRHEKVKK